MHKDCDLCCAENQCFTHLLPTYIFGPGPNAQEQGFQPHIDTLCALPIVDPLQIGCMNRKAASLQEWGGMQLHITSVSPAASAAWGRVFSPGLDVDFCCSLEGLPREERCREDETWATKRYVCEPAARRAYDNQLCQAKPGTVQGCRC